jgi:hypothetical protein
MKSLITRIASIGIFSLVLAGLSATTQADITDPTQVHIDKAVVNIYGASVTSVLIEVTALCYGGTGLITVHISQSSTQSNAGTTTTNAGPYTQQVKCDGEPRTVAVSTGVLPINMGQADVTAALMATSGSPSKTRTIGVGFPATEHGDDD